MTPHNAFDPLAKVAGWPNSICRGLLVDGDWDPILPTSFRIGEAAVASLSAVGLAAARLWELKTGKSQEVSVDTRRATASLRSGKYMKMDNSVVSTDRNTIMGTYPTKNGRWSYLHCNFPNHRAAALDVLGVDEDPNEVKKAVARWDALELEEAIIKAKGAGGMVRSIEEWSRHPQGQAIADLPLMEIIKVGESPPEKLPDGDRPLSGIRVLDYDGIHSENHANMLSWVRNIERHCMGGKSRHIRNHEKTTTAATKT